MIRYIWLILILITGQSHGTSQKIPGTQVIMTIPQGFELAQQFSGIEDPSTQSVVMILNLPIPYEEITKVFTQTESLKKQQLTLIEQTILNIDGEMATLINLNQSTAKGDFIKWVLLMGDEQESLMVNGMFPLEHKQHLEPLIKNVVMSARWDKSKPTSVLDGINFIVTEGEHLKFNQEMKLQTMVSLNDPKAEFSAPLGTHALLVIAQSFSKQPISNLANFSKKRLYQHGDELTDIVIEHSSQVSYGGLVGYRIKASALNNKTQTKMALWQVILTSNETYYLAIGFTSYDKKDIDFTEFESILSSFQEKETSQNSKISVNSKTSKVVENELVFSIVPNAPFLYAGERIKGQLVIIPNLKDQVETQLLAMTGLKILPYKFGEEPTFESFTHFFYFQLDQEGKQTIGPFSIDFLGTTFVSNQLEVEVVKKAQNDSGIIGINLLPPENHKIDQLIQIDVSYVSADQNSLIDLKIDPDSIYTIGSTSTSNSTSYHDGQYEYKTTISFQLTCDRPEITIDESWFPYLTEDVSVQSKTIQCLK